MNIENGLELVWTFQRIPPWTITCWKPETNNDVTNSGKRGIVGNKVGMITFDMEPSFPMLEYDFLQLKKRI